ncbi:MAG: class 3 adenylate cyclase [Myxococcota bacterium]|jgi:class 3 adenylate cyclase
MTPPERLTTILVADVSGDVLDESRQHRLTLYNRALETEAARHGGKILDQRGDHYVVEFRAPSGAVFCALETLRTVDQELPEGILVAPLGIQIGVYTGDLTGVAATATGTAHERAERLQRHAPPDCVAITETLLHHTGERLFASATRLGRKDVGEPEGSTRLFALRPGTDRLPVFADLAAQVQADQPSAGPRWAAYATIATILFAGLYLGGYVGEPGATPADASSVSRPLNAGFLGEAGQAAVYPPEGTLAAIIAEAVYEPLVEFTDDGSIRAGLVEQWRVRDQGRVLELVLRRDITFQPSSCTGSQTRRANAEDLAWSIRLAQKRGLVHAMGDVEAVDGTTVRLVRAGGGAFPLADLTSVRLVPRRLGLCDNAGWQHPVGTGPFLADTPPHDGVIILRRWDGWWAASERGLPPVREVRLRRLTDAGQAVQALASGQLDLVRAAPYLALNVAQGLHWGEPKLHEALADRPVDVLVRRDSARTRMTLLAITSDAVPASVRRTLAARLDVEELASHSPLALRPTRTLDAVSPPAGAVVAPADSDAGHVNGNTVRVGVVGQPAAFHRALEAELAAAAPGIAFSVQPLPRGSLPRALSGRGADIVVFDYAAPAHTGDASPWLIGLGRLATLWSADGDIKRAVSQAAAAPRGDSRKAQLDALQGDLQKTGRFIPIGTWQAGRPTEVLLLRRGVAHLPARAGEARGEPFSVIRTPAL